MAEYIDRENLAKEGWYLQRHVYGDGHAAIETKKIIDIPAADTRPKWISVKDKLPEPRVEVLVYIQPKNKEQPHPAFISLDFLEHGGYWAESTQPWECEATHWMPLPEPPKEET